jgi:shikimate kinase
VILMGLRGSGKSSLAQLLVRSGLMPRAVDLDPLTASRLGVAGAGEAIQAAGIQAFREAEAEALREVLHGAGHGGSEGLVLALGGGTPTAPGAAELLRDARDAGWLLVYLRAMPTTLRERLMHDRAAAARPSLTGKGTLEEIDELFSQRDELYRGLSSSVIEVDGLNAAAVCDRVRTLLDGGR